MVFDEAAEKYFVVDTGSSNGTYIALVGPYSMRYKLRLNDDFLVGRTGFSVNRFYIGVFEEIGVRPTMEDDTAIFQYLRIPGYTSPSVAPLSYFAVYDGHGGPDASRYLAQYLHLNVVDGLKDVAAAVHAAADSATVDGIITSALQEAFLKTDKAFITASASTGREDGSTATTVLILGQRMYCANVGDSRTLLCRKFSPVPLSYDQKPTRVDEAKRVRDAGGIIRENRVMGILAVTRSFGDAYFKQSVREILHSDGTKVATEPLDESKNLDSPLVIATPEIEVMTCSCCTDRLSIH